MLFLLSACTPEPDATPANAFLAAEVETGVPVELLLAIAKAETGLQDVQGVAEFPDQDVGYGVMGLRQGVIDHAANLAGLEV